MAKVGYIFKENNDSFDAEREWMQRYGCVQIVEETSQDLQKIYHDCGQFYACRTDVFLKEGTTDVKGQVPLVLTEMEVQDIDTLEDWEIAEIKYRRLHSES